jgi:branched-chain amino acid aminotransferase
VNAVKETVKANGFEECYIRPLVYLTDGGWNLNVDTGKAGVGIAVWEWNHYLGEEAMEKGVRANISSFTRHHPNVMLTKAKISGNYANSILAKTESVRLGFDEAILLDPQGYVAECTGENIFVVRNG